MRKIEAVQWTDSGSRPINQDSLLVVQGENFFLAAVADGLGGHRFGEVASQTALSTVRDLVSQGQPVPFETIYEACQNAIVEKQKELGVVGQMCTTLNIVYVYNDEIHWSHIGDSRTYYFENQQMVQRTRDHSVPQMLYEAGEIQESDIRFHEDRSRMLRALGTKTDEVPKFTEEKVLPAKGNQQFLLCSDGFWEFINETQMDICLANADDTAQWIEDMKELMRRNAAGKETDNITAVCVWIR